jgi:hypothetical protein
VPTPAEWPAALSWAAGRRAEVIERIIAAVERQRCPGCRAAEADGWITLYQAGA